MSFGAFCTAGSPLTCDRNELISLLLTTIHIFAVENDETMVFQYNCGMGDS